MKQLQWFFRLGRSRRLAVIALPAVVLAVISISGGKRDDTRASAPGFVALERGSIEEVVTAQGKLEPKEYVDVGAQVSGQLKKIHVEIGDVVQAGALLAEIDARVYEARVQVDKARLQTLHAQLAEQAAQIEYARQQVERDRKLIKSNAVSLEALQRSETDLKVAEARAESLKAQVEEAKSTLAGDEANLSYTKIYAPMSGTIVTLPAREGQTLNANQSAPILLQIANLETMTVRAQVAEADVSRIEPGTEAYFTTLGSLDRRWKGIVRQILPSPEVINEVVLYNALVDVDNKQRELMNGMSAQVFFVLDRAENALLLPVSALGERVPEQDRENARAYQVSVKRGQKPEQRVVWIGAMDRTRAAVVDGLEATDMVALTSPAAGGQAGQRRRFPGGPRL